MLGGLLCKHATQTRIQSSWPDTGILIEDLANPDQGRQRKMIGYFFRPSHGSQKNRIKRPQHVQVIIRNQHSCLCPELVAPGKGLQIQLKRPVHLLHCAQHTNCLFDHLRTNPVTRIKSDSMCHSCHFSFDSNRHHWLPDQLQPCLVAIFPTLFPVFHR